MYIHVRKECMFNIMKISTLYNYTSRTATNEKMKSIRHAYNNHMHSTNFKNLNPLIVFIGHYELALAVNTHVSRVVEHSWM